MAGRLRGAYFHPMNGYLEASQEQLDRLLQESIRRLAVALVGLDLVEGAIHVLTLPADHLRALLPMGLLSLGAMAAVALWLRTPRPAAQAQAAGGLATLLTVATALLHLSLAKDTHESMDLILVEVGAGFFLASPLWFGLVTGTVLLGWGLVMSLLPMGDHALHFGGGLCIAACLAWGIHLVRQRMLGDLAELQARGLRQEAELREALERIRTLSGLIPICAQCKKIRDDHGRWNPMEAYVEAHSGASFSHGLCPDCLAAARAEWEGMRG